MIRKEANNVLQDAAAIAHPLATLLLKKKKKEKGKKREKKRKSSHCLKIHRVEFNACRRHLQALLPLPPFSSLNPSNNIFCVYRNPVIAK